MHSSKPEQVTPEGPELNSLEWTHDDHGNPLLCVAGKDPRIKVLNVISGEVVMVVLTCCQALRPSTDCGTESGWSRSGELLLLSRCVVDKCI
jgi:hypothetical protein